MKYIVTNLARGTQKTFKKLKPAQDYAEEQEVEFVERGWHVIGYEMQPKVKQRDMQFGRVVYTSWRSNFWQPLISITEKP